MPQFETEYFASQIFWLLICFAVVYFLSKKLFMPKMSKIIDNRYDKIRQLQIDAENINKDLLEINNNIEIVRRDSITKYSKIISEAKREFSQKRIDFVKENQSQISMLQNKSNLLTEDILNDYSNSSQTAIDVLVRKISDKLISKKIN
jgi:F-type H+-transporting ATPase subunit b